MPSHLTVIYPFLFLYSWGWDATWTHGWWNFILLLILTDLKDGKKKMLTLSFYEIDQTLYN